MRDVDSRLWQRLIMVQGHRRSGTTWLAAVLGKAAGVNLIPFEPLWLKHHPATDDTALLRKMRSERGWYHNFDPGNPQHVEQTELIHRHLEALVQHYFGGPVNTLIIKEPHPNWMPVLKEALKPDYVLFLDRHPLGILNSYEKSSLYEKWETADEWQKFLEDIRTIQPDSLPELMKINHPAKRVVYMAYIARQLCLESIVSIPHSVVDYEKLCLQPFGGFESMFNMLGLQWNEDTRAQVKPLVDPDGENEPGFVSVRKRSYDRAYAWRHEMAPHFVRMSKRFLEEIGWEIDDDEADGSQSLQEGVKGTVKYLHRRAKWLRKFGPRAVLRSL